MHMIRILPVLFVFPLFAGMGGCRPTKTPPPAPPPAKVVVTKPITTKVPEFADYNGHLESPDVVEVRARVRGFLTKINFTEGQEVAKDDPLYEVDKREYTTAQRKAKADVDKAKADIGNWKAQILLAQADLERATKTAATGATAKTDLDKAQATLDVNKAQLEAAKATLEAMEAAEHTSEILLGYTDIKAKIAGRINRTLVTEGNLVGQSDPTLLTTIVKVDELFVYFDVPEADLVAYQRELIKAGMVDDITSRTVDVLVGVATEQGYPHAGKIDFRENRVDSNTGTVRIRGRVPNPKVNNTRLLYPGLYARVRVPRGPDQPRLGLPEDCIQTGQEGAYVYVVRPDDTVEKRLVTTGPAFWRIPRAELGELPPAWTLATDAETKGPTRRTLKAMVPILAGLKADERVMVEGMQKTRPDQKVDPMEWKLVPPPAAPAAKAGGAKE